MARSVKVHPDHRSTVIQALQRSGFLTQGQLAVHLNLALSTVNNFFRGLNVSVTTFELICDVLDLDPHILTTSSSPKLEFQKQIHSDFDQDKGSSTESLTVNNLPLSGVVEFVGRQDLLQEISLSLQQKEQVAIVAIEGMGGVGKTELALQYAKDHLAEYSGGVCWIRCRSDSVGAQILQFAKGLLKLSPPDDVDLLTQVQFCWQNWRDGLVLLIFDDVLDYEQLKPYLPLAHQFKILMTTRLQLGTSIHQLVIDVLTEDEALELLGSLIRKERVEQQKAAATDLCRRLGCLPLAIELLGRYLKHKPDLSLEEMTQRLEDKRLDQLSLRKSKREADMTAQLGVRDAFELSWQELDPSAQELGCLLSLFAPEPIPWYLVQRCFPDQDPEELEDLRDTNLVYLQLLQSKGNETYQLHPLVRDFFREKLSDQEEREKLCSLLVTAALEVATSIPRDPTIDLLDRVSDAIPHLIEVLIHYVERIDPESLLPTYMGIIGFYTGRSLYEQALVWNRRCRNTLAQRLGPDAPDLATSLDTMALIHILKGQYGHSTTELLQQALDIRQKAFDPEDPSIAESLNNLAELYLHQGNYEEAEALLHRALTINQKYQDSQDLSIAQNQHNLAILYYLQGHYEEAEPLLSQSISTAKQKMGTDHPMVAARLNDLANLYRAQGLYDKAEPLYLQALSLRKKLLGSEHPDVASSLDSLASLYYVLRRYEEAEPKYREALTLRKKLLGNEHPDVATSLNNLAMFYYMQDRYPEAEDLYKEALHIRQRLLGTEHPDIAITLNDLGYLCMVQERYDEAKDYYETALEMRKNILGEDHPDIAANLSNFAALYQVQREYEQAERFYLDAIRIREKTLGHKHPEIGTSFVNLAKFYEEIEDYKKAKDYYQRAYRILRARLGTSHQYVKDIKSKITNLKRQ